MYNVHKEHPAVLEDEPKYINVAKLTVVQVNAPHIQASILEFIGILRSREDGYVKPGQEAGLEVEDAEPMNAELSVEASIPTETRRESSKLRPRWCPPASLIAEI
jgi:hypothetical protein